MIKKYKCDFCEQYFTQKQLDGDLMCPQCLENIDPENYKMFGSKDDQQSEYDQEDQQYEDDEYDQDDQQYKDDEYDQDDQQYKDDEYNQYYQQG